MALTILHVMFAVAGIYLAAGLLFAIPFVFRGVNRMDPVAEHGTPGFRIIIIPGVMVFWPVLAWRWCRGQRNPPVECNAHRRAARRFDVAQ